MHKTRRWVASSLSVLLILLIGYAAFMWLLFRNDAEFEAPSVSAYRELIAGLPENFVGYRAQIAALDPQTSTARVTFYPFVVVGEYDAMLTPGETNEALDNDLEGPDDMYAPDELDALGEIKGFFDENFSAGVYTPVSRGWVNVFSPVSRGAIDSYIPLIPDEDAQPFERLMGVVPRQDWVQDTARLYPFDSYSLDLSVSGTFPCTEDTLPEDEQDRYLDAFIDDAPFTTDCLLDVLLLEGQSYVDGFIIASVPSLPDSQRSEWTYSRADLALELTRDTPTKFLALVISLLMIASAGSVFIMGILVAANHRPPALQALIWAAALTFALIQLRDLFPGEPPIGMALDYVVYFPALIISIASSVWILIMWSKRADYQ